MAHEGVAGIARQVEMLDDIHSSADLPVVKPKHEMTDGRSQKSDDKGKKVRGWEGVKAKRDP